MNYYKRHIGDYAKKAGHLSVLEHGVYTLLLDAYYDRELAPTENEAIRIARARTPDELAAVKAVLADFFVLENGRYTQARVEEEFLLAEQVARQNSENGKKGGRPRKPKGKRKESEGLAKGNPNLSEKKPNPLIHKEEQEQKKEAPPAEAVETLDPKKAAFYAALAILGDRTLTAKKLGEVGGEVMGWAVSETLGQKPIDPKTYLLGLLKPNPSRKGKTDRFGYVMDEYGRRTGERGAVY